MALIIEKTDCDPIDRRYMCNVENQNRIENILTLGACSYITWLGAEFDRMPESGAHHPAHILVGRFCSFADDLTFIVGFNHTYKGATSTYPFEDPERIKKIAAYGVETPRPFEVPENRRAIANSYQNIFGHDVWIGYGVTVMGGVKVGTGAIIGAKSVVAKDIPPYAVAVGNPARVVKYRFDAETVKKFLAVKWWNWSLEKILDNCPLMKDAEKFLATHYTPALENFPEDDIGRQIASLRAQRRKVYNFIADFGVEHPLRLRIVRGFCQSNFKSSVLVIWLGKDSTECDFKLLSEAVQIFNDGAAKNIIVAETQGGLNFSPYALRQGTHFITTREMTTLEALDYLWGTDVKIVSALDDGIFDGEPLVEWQAL